jgi:transposase, IS5 family
MAIPSKKRASSPKYVSPSQTVLVGFESPFSQKLDPSNRWILLADRIPWDKIVAQYNKQMSGSKEGRPPISGRIVIGALILKHINNWDDRETILQIQENMYMQYFLGLDSFSTAPVFDASLFVEIRKRMTDTVLNAINEEIVLTYLAPPAVQVSKKTDSPPVNPPPQDKENNDGDQTPPSNIEVAAPITHWGRMITDATACPQDIAYPTDLNLLSEAREMTEGYIDLLFDEPAIKEELQKPRTYRQNARKDYLLVAKNKNKSKKTIRKAIGKQLRYLRRNLKNIDLLLQAYELQKLDFPLLHSAQRYLWIIHTLYEQQQQMHRTCTHSVADRIVSLHQPHVRPIPRGKTNAKIEFGAKIEVSLVNGFAFLDELSWDAFHEGNHLMSYIDNYKKRFGYYPEEVLADGIFSSRENRKKLKGLGIKLLAKPLGRPSKTAVKEYISPGERNPIEGKFGQGKTAYGLGCIKARLKETSQSWIASIILVLNLVKVAGLNLYCLYFAKLKSNFSIILSQIKIQIALFRPNLNNAIW